MRLGKRTVRCIAITKICRVHFWKCWNAILPCFQSGRLVLGKQVWHSTSRNPYQNTGHFPVSRAQFEWCTRGQVWTLSIGSSALVVLRWISLGISSHWDLAWLTCYWHLLEWGGGEDSLSSPEFHSSFGLSDTRGGPGASCGGEDQSTMV